MLNLKVYADNANKFAKKLVKFSLSDEMEKFAKQEQDKLRRIRPRKDAGAFKRLATPAQKRAFWAKYPNGKSASGNTARGWEMKRSGKFGFVIENRAEGAYWVFDDTGQQPYLKNWPTTSKLAENIRKEGATFTVTVIKNLLK